MKKNIKPVCDTNQGVRWGPTLKLNYYKDTHHTVPVKNISTICDTVCVFGKI